MQYKYPTTIALLALLAIATACSSGPDEVADEQASTPPPQLDAAQAFEASAQWLPSDSDVVISLSGPSMWEALGYGLLPTTNPHAEPGTLGTIEGLRTDLGAVLDQYFGFDFGKSHSLVAAMDIDGNLVSLVLLGEFDDPTTATPVELGPKTAYELDINAALGQEMTPANKLYALPIDEPRRGLVLSVGPEELASLTDGAGLDAVSDQSTFARLFDDAYGSTLAVAITAEHMQHMAADFAAMGMPVPSAAMVSYGDDLRATIEGESVALERIATMAMDYLEHFRTETADRYHAEEYSYLERLEVIYLYHSITALSDQLLPELEGNSLRYEVELTDQGSRFEVLLASLAPYAFYAARTAYDEYFGDDYFDSAQTSKSTTTLELAADSAVRYCEFDQQYSIIDGAEPWHMAEPDDPARRAGMPVVFDYKVFPGGPDIEITTSPTVPEDGEEIVPDFHIEGDVDFDAAPVLQALTLYNSAPSRFRYTYRTGSETGSEATAEIVAEANFDPSTPEHHREVVELYVEDDGECWATPIYTEYEHH